MSTETIGCNNDKCPIAKYCRRLEMKSLASKIGDFSYSTSTGICKGFWGLPQKLYLSVLSAIIKDNNGNLKIEFMMTVDEIKKVVKEHQNILSYEERLDSVPLHVIQAFYEEHMNGRLELKR
jgi:hypothetical protein